MSTTGMIRPRADDDVKHKAPGGQTIPVPHEAPNAVTQAAMEEARAMGKARFANADALFDTLGQAAKP